MQEPQEGLGELARPAVQLGVDLQQVRPGVVGVGGCVAPPLGLPVVDHLGVDLESLEGAQGAEVTVELVDITGMVTIKF